MEDLRSFVVTMLAMFILFVLAFFKDYDIETPFMSIVIAYIIGRGAQKASHVWAAARDPSADTKSVIESIEKTE